MAFILPAFVDVVEKGIRSVFGFKNGLDEKLTFQLKLGKSKTHQHIFR